jgi:hypothetical protein
VLINEPSCMGCLLEHRVPTNYALLKVQRRFWTRNIYLFDRTGRWWCKPIEKLSAKYVGWIITPLPLGEKEAECRALVCRHLNFFLEAGNPSGPNPLFWPGSQPRPHALKQPCTTRGWL